MKATPKFKVVYNEDREAESKGKLQINVKDNNDEAVKGAKFEILNGDVVIETIETTEVGEVLAKLDPGTYTVRYTGNLESYEAHEEVYEITIEAAFDEEEIDLTLEKIEKDDSDDDSNGGSDGDSDDDSDDDSVEVKPNKPNGSLPQTGNLGAIGLIGLSGALAAIGRVFLKKKK